MADATSSCSKAWGLCLADPRCEDKDCPGRPGNPVPPGRMDLTGQRYGRLLVVAFIVVSKKRESMWRVRCDCGNEKTIASSTLRTSHTQSCGCLEAETRRRNLEGIAQRRRTHGLTDTSTYYSYHAMLQRCHNPKAPAFPKYGAKGIAVCASWRDSFETFLADMGARPEGTSLDRYPDNRGNYEPGNCRWATPEQQCNNKRNNVRIELDGRVQTTTQWAREFGLNPDRVMQRLAKGWSALKALRTPVRGQGGSR